jgi:GNAT superfamily N-acetyltransferase
VSAATPAGIVIRRLQAREWPAYRALRLRSLADAPGAFGSNLALEESWAHELWMARLMAASGSGRDCPLIAEQDGAAVGLVWAKCDAVDAALVNVFQMWVAPEARGRGLAAALLDDVLAWARSIGAHTVQLGVVCGNGAAERLYQRCGFLKVGEPAPIRPGSPLLEQVMQRDLVPSLRH